MTEGPKHINLNEFLQHQPGGVASGNDIELWVVAVF